MWLRGGRDCKKSRFLFVCWHVLQVLSEGLTHFLHFMPKKAWKPPIFVNVSLISVKCAKQFSNLSISASMPEDFKSIKFQQNMEDSISILLDQTSLLCFARYE